MHFAPKLQIEAQSMRRTKSPQTDYRHKNQSRMANEIFKRGGLVQAGAHGQMQGLGFIWEMNMFWNQGEMSPYDVFKVATINGAKSLGLDGQIGSIKVGKLADLVIYKAEDNPLANFSNTKFVSQVMLDGILYDTNTMNQIFPEFKECPPLPPINIPQF